MKKMIFLFVIVMVFSFSKAQPLQYFMQRSSANIASISEIQSLQVFLSGAHSFVGFEGAPKSIFLNVTSPIAKKQHTGFYSHPQNKDAQHLRNFVGATLSNETFGVHFDLHASLGYGYRFWVGERANITFGVSAGVNQFGSDYDKISGDPLSSIRSTKTTDFAFQFGTRIEAGKLNISAFGNENIMSGEIVFGRLWDYSTQASQSNLYYDDDKKKTWHGQLSVMFSHNKKTNTNLFRFSANAVYRDGLGLGISYQTNKDLSANVSLRFSKSLRIGYAYQLLQLNRIVPKHEIAIRYKFIRATEH
jgi:type IX secretion system PorP/SprF family membrane protein